MNIGASSHKTESSHVQRPHGVIREHWNYDLSQTLDHNLSSIYILDFIVLGVWRAEAEADYCPGVQRWLL